jgi:murein DD-endopeptidase MepM/ murein hydrolase activator NlpD
MHKLIRYGLLVVFINAAIVVIGPYVERMIYAIRLAAMPLPAVYRLPVQDVRFSQLQDSWHAPRDGGWRRHEGIDIFAPRGTAVRAATEGVILRIGHGGLGGRAVWVMGPGGQRHYYAHLDRFAGVFTGMRVQAGTLLGYVGNSGNAKGTPPHLHYGIYTASGAVNPYPLLAPAPG